MKRTLSSIFTAAGLMLLLNLPAWAQTNCGLQIEYTVSPSDPLTYTFHALPTDSLSISCFDSSTVYNWDLGNGVMRYGLSITYTFNSPGIQYVCLDATSVFGNPVGTCDTIFVGQNPQCALNFSFQQALPTIPLTYQFTPTTVTPNCFTGYRWTWGDGTLTDTNSPNAVIKTFPAQGMYNVCLTGFRSGSAPVEICNAVLVTHTNPMVGIGGMVRADGYCFNGPLLVELIALDGPELYLDTLLPGVDSCFYYFSIPQAPLRVWTVRASPVNNQDYVNTYLGDVLFFDEATLFTTPSNWQNLPPINLLGNYYDSLIAGNTNPQGIVTGQVNGNGTTVTATVQGHNLSTTFLAGAARIIALNANGNAVAVAMVQPDGSYSLPTLPEGNYLIRVEHPGVPSQPVPIQVTAGGASINFNATTTGITVVTGNQEKLASTTVMVYPNPASQYITVNGFVGKVSLLDMAGKVLQTIDAQSYINIKNLPAGMFTLKGYNENGLPVSTKFVKK